MKVDLIVDARHKSCPGPLMTLVEAIRKAVPGQIVMLLSTDPASPKDVEEWASIVGHKVIKVEKIDDTYQIYLEVKT
ncbi:MAG: sulfurtransferase TusA family protein [Candidatus Methanomethyliaceae archaeon]|nr:sulfurtransferase TusA family protein [Candidatus Methanomethyliaceae archaeon]MDW7970267.1 sulfurtransferase TusA family protein [Nitrososphaerota archaeon]